MRPHVRWSLGLLALSVAGCAAETSSQQLAHRAPPEVEARRVWVATGDLYLNYYSSAPSPDGRYITEIDWTTGDLAVIDLSTGEYRRVTDKGPWPRSDDYAEYAVFAPDSRRIAYSWFKGRLGHPDAAVHGYELRIIDVDGSGEHVLVPAREDVRYIIPEDWSADGRLLLVTTARRDRTVELGLLSVEDGSYRILESLDWRFPELAAFSPDGRWIAYDLPKDARTRQRDIHVLAVDGSRKATVVSSPDNERLVDWLPDGSGIVFHRQDAANPALWKLEVREGRTVGRPELVQPELWLVHPFGASRDAFFYGLETGSNIIHTAMIDIDNARLLSAPAPVQEVTNRSAFGAWSPDGRSHAYLAPVIGVGGADLVIQSLTGETLKRMVLPFTDAVRNLQWVAGGMFAAGVDMDGRSGVHRIDVEAETIALVLPLDEREGAFNWYTAAPDGRTIYYLGTTGDPTRAEIVAYDVATRTRRTLREVSGGRRISVSPDGGMIAYVDMLNGQRHIFVAPVGGGEPRAIHHITGSGGGNRGALPFSHDGRFILWREVRETADAVLWRIAVDGSGAVLIPGLSRASGLSLAVSPDGRRISFEHRLPSPEEIWMVRGVTGFGPRASDR